MNLNEYQGSFVCKPPSSFTPTNENYKFQIFVISDNHLKIVGLLGEKFVFFSFLWEFKLKKIFITQRQELSSTFQSFKQMLEQQKSDA